MRCEIHFDRSRDLSEPSQTGFVDLSLLLSQGVIPPGLNVTESGFNNIEDPDSIIGRPEDPFHAMQMAHDITERAAQAEKAAAAKQARAAAQASS